MSQLDIFQATPPPEPARAHVPKRKPRYYQAECLECVRDQLVGGPLEDGVRSTLIVKATGLGKTATFSELIRTWEGRCLVIAHREELITQARQALIEQTGERVGIEKAEFSASGERIIVTSIQTMSRRLDRFPANYFSLIVVDEGHRAVADSYVRTLNHFSEAKVLLVTATPDRADEKALGAVVDSVSYVMDIEDGIEAGYLVPVKAREFRVDVDLSNISTVSGDLAQGELDEAMLGVVEGVVDQTLAYAGSEQCIVFTPGVRSAHAMCERANLLRAGCAIAIDGSTDKDQRRDLVAGFRARKYQFLFNCAIATEGFDAPATSIVALARPTKSRSLCAQMVGRGTRVLPGVVDHIEGAEGAAERRAAIAASAKPYMTIFNFVGEAGKHSLVTPTDVLGGNYSEEEVEEAKKRQRSAPDEDIRTSLKVARNELAALAKRLAEAKAKVSASIVNYDPFAVLGVNRDDVVTTRFGGKPATDKQRDLLMKFGLPQADVMKLDTAAAKRLLSAQYKRIDAGLASLKQIGALARWTPVPPDLTFQNAGRAMTYLSQECAFGKRKKVDGSTLERIMRGG